MRPKFPLLILVLLTALFLGGCNQTQQEITGPSEDSTPLPSTEATTEATTEPLRPAGWEEVDGIRRYLLEGGIPASGWTDIDGYRYYLDSDGTPCTGWLEDGGQTYYLLEDGIIATGWMTFDNNQYYFLEDGTMAVGEAIIDDVPHYFSPKGVYVVLVNPWLTVPEDYTANLLPIDDSHFAEITCYDALMQMLEACENAGMDPFVCSGYRSQDEQESLYWNKVEAIVEEQGYPEEYAQIAAASVVAVPGTSEHQLGLAFDIIHAGFPYLTKDQENTSTQTWLMEHCWEYGFILRYPNGTTDITGIIYEPWHYRYVGVEIAQEIHELGITLEEYLGFTHE